MAELPEHLRCFEDYFHDDTFEYPDLLASSELPTETLEPTLIMEQPLPPSRSAMFWHECIEIAKEVRESMHPRRLRPYALQLGLGSAAIVTGVAVALFSSQETSETPQASSRSEQPVASQTPTEKTSKSDRPQRSPSADSTYITLQNMAWPSTEANQPRLHEAQSPSPIWITPTVPVPAASTDPSHIPVLPPPRIETPPASPTPAPPTEHETTDPPVASPSDTPTASESPAATESASPTPAATESLFSTSAVPETSPTFEPPTPGD